jgi:hypothetical protein
MRYLVAVIAVAILLAPVLIAATSRRGRVTSCCGPADPAQDRRLQEGSEPGR